MKGRTIKACAGSCLIVLLSLELSQSHSLPTMESFHQYLQSIDQNWEKKPINFGVITIQELQPDNFQQIIDLRTREEFEEDNITSSLNVPMLSRSDELGILERCEEESFIISLVWSGSLIETNINY